MLVRQLLIKEDVSLSWAELVLQLACHVSEVVSPDVRTDNDDMDIRQYVQIKKVNCESRIFIYNLPFSLCTEVHNENVNLSTVYSVESES